MGRDDVSKRIKAKALGLGFSACGIAKAEKLSEEETQVQSYLEKGYHGEMRYMENHFEKRLDPRLLEPDTKSVISVLLNYYPSKGQIDPEAPVISKYAYGKDYHFVMKEMLSELLAFMQDEIPETQGRAFVDSAPVLDRAWAVKSGLGWIGKNGNLIAPKKGSFFFIGELLVNIDLTYDKPLETDFCGSCTRCIERCPTNAIVSPKVVDGSKCLSYLTIEYRGNDLSDKFKERLEDRLFGCDLCQDICPHNRFSTPTTIPDFTPIEGLLERSKKAWFDMEKTDFTPWAKRSAFHRTGFNGIKRNLNFLQPQGKQNDTASE